MSAIKTLSRLVLGGALVFAGLSHLTFARLTFQAQVPSWLPLDPDFVVISSGLVEIGLGIALIFLKKRRKLVGWLTAGFFLAIFPGHMSQFLTQSVAFGLNTDEARAIRLLFQPLLILWALWSTAAWSKTSK